MPRNINQVADLFVRDTEQWDAVIIRQWFEEESAEAILNIPRHDRAEEDLVIWAPDPKGKYSVKSAYEEH